MADGKKNLEISWKERKDNYDDEETRKMIEAIRLQEIDKEMNQRTRYEKTSQSKDVIIEAKDKRIVKLEAEVRKLKAEIEVLRGLLYESK